MRPSFSRLTFYNCKFLSTALDASHKFWYVVLSSFISTFLTESRVLKSPNIIFELSISPFNSVSTCILGLSCSSDWIISINLFQSLWILFSTNSDLMLSLSSKIISITVLFHSRPLTLFIICIYFSILYLLRHCSHIFP